MTLVVLYTIFFCGICPVIYLMRRQDSNRHAAKGVVHATQSDKVSDDEDDDGLENHT